MGFNVIILLNMFLKKFILNLARGHFLAIETEKNIKFRSDFELFNADSLRKKNVSLQQLNSLL